MTLPMIVRRYLDAYNRKDVATLVDCVADGIVFENVSSSGQQMTVAGRTAFAELATRAAAMVVRRNQAVRTAVVAGDRVALEIDWTGVAADDPAAVVTTLRGASFLTLANGRIARIVDIA